ncbi:PREDICTED: uncharacterized protein LOC108783131 [Cyphomyrmex costatus]|uniref:CABIT domain-containing protein n=1 Tax=Cyphomyrmex costatus TaxID=456900 RepID=A0A151IMX2_9HYME|nr:PREDICTED: uncharacterized protein LOC108783131 [Cyphomyrmex costatus]KYN06299.1 hypothetical protein ALC62_02791 [Cyphomyrmex costatus]
MSSNGEFSTMSSEEMPSLPKSLPSSREATAEGGSGSSGGYMPLREFLDRFSLPRVVRLEGTGGRPVLLYKQQQRSLRVTASLLMHRYRHDVKVGPEIVIPEGYPGWFSVISGNNTTGSARVYRRVDSLVKTGVPAFLLATPLRAYTLTHSKMENGNLRAHYTKTTIRAGEILRLVAVFQDTRRCSSVSFGISSGCPEKDQYAQCIDLHGREVFASLSTRGEFYAICQGGNDTGSDAVLYKVHHLAKRQLPLRVRLIAGPLPVPLPKEYGGLMQLETSTRGPIVLGCVVPERPVHNPEMLELVVSGNGAPRVRRARLGYPSEARLLASPKMQRLLSACSRTVGDRATEPRVAPTKLHSPTVESLKEMHLKKIKPKPETKPILQSLKDGLEHLKRNSVKERNQQTKQSTGNGILERISKLTQGNRNRNPAKKSASFTFAVRPEIAMRSQERYSSLEPETTSHQTRQNQNAKQPVQRSVSTSVLEIPCVELQPNYSRVRDSLTPLPSLPKLVKTSNNKTEEIYAEICDTATANQAQKCPGSHVMARIRIVVQGNDSSLGAHNVISNERYMNSMATSEQIDSIISTEDEVIYNTVF